MMQKVNLDNINILALSTDVGMLMLAHGAAGIAVDS